MLAGDFKREDTGMKGLVLLAVILSASVAFGQEDPGPLYDNTPDPCPTYESCTLDGSGTSSSSPGYSYCVARKSAGQECQDVVTIYRVGTPCATGCRTCAGVTHSASCQCDSSTLEVSGTCTYW